jgi:ABC-type antimicrobial peptide transport system permease subunit
VSVLSTNYTLVQGTSGIRAFGLDRVRGVVAYALRSGVQPVGPDEVVIGPVTARKLHLAVGDTANVALCPCTGVAATTSLAPVRVVGTALFPEDDEGNFSDALGFSGPGFANHVGDVGTPRVAVRLAAGRSLPAVASDLGRRYPGQLSSYSYPSRPGDVENLASLRSFPRILAGVASLLGLAALANMLVTTLRRRRGELATLCSLGLTPRQAGGCVVGQSVSVAGLALALGVPLGILAGAGVWRAATSGIGVATDATHPLVSIAVVSLAAIALAIAISLPVASRAAHMRPAEALRSE